MNYKTLSQQIHSKKSALCVGLDTDMAKIPSHLQAEKDPIFAFNRVIIDATYPYAVAYKPNLAFYEALGSSGWESLQRTMEYMPKDVFTIADAKRGDIGNTATLYAKAFFETMNFDAVTVSPYMGSDTIEPFLQFPEKWAVVLGLTSNPSAKELQGLPINGKLLYEVLIEKLARDYSPEKLMFVVGATQADAFVKIRQIAPKHFFLVPGVGAQGGDLAAVCKHGMHADGGLLINSSRGILYAGGGKDFGSAAAREAQRLQTEIAKYL